ICIVHPRVDIDWDYVAVQRPLLLTVGALVSGPGVAAPARPRRRVLGATVGGGALPARYSLPPPWHAQRSLAAAGTAAAHLRLAGPVHADGAWAERRGVADVAEEVAEGLNATCRGVGRAGAAVSVQDDDGGFASLESRLLRGRGGLRAMTWCAGRRRRFAQMV